eukprot:m.182571 g.182571  ORF g.182571 m.182571 type:complete len:103 (+) comp15566_c0_seq1:57-365(+)
MADGWPKGGSNRHKKPRQLAMDELHPTVRQGIGMLEHGFASGKIIHVGFYNDFTDDLHLVAPPHARSALKRAVEAVQAENAAAAGKQAAASSGDGASSAMSN